MNIPAYVPVGDRKCKDCGHREHKGKCYTAVIRFSLADRKGNEVLPIQGSQKMCPCLAMTGNASWGERIST